VRNGIPNGGSGYWKSTRTNIMKHVRTQGKMSAERKMKPFVLAINVDISRLIGRYHFVGDAGLLASDLVLKTIVFVLR